MTSTSSYRHRLAGGLVGVLLGDALGVPYEFHPPETIPAADLIEYAPPPGFRRAHAGVPPGLVRQRAQASPAVTQRDAAAKNYVGPAERNMSFDGSMKHVRLEPYFQHDHMGARHWA